MRFFAPAFLALAVTVAAPALAHDIKQEEPRTAEKTEKAKGPKKICKRVSSMGSNRKERVCMTRKDWRAFNRGE